MKGAQLTCLCVTSLKQRIEEICSFFIVVKGKMIEKKTKAQVYTKEKYIY